MKRHLIAALLGLAVSVPALAVDFVANGAADSAIGPTPGSEQSLQTIVTTLFPGSGINVNTDQSSSAFWGSSTPSSTSMIPTVVAEFTANAGTQAFGIWFGTDTDHIVSYDLLLGGATTGKAAGLTIAGNTLEVFGNCSIVNCGTFSNALINTTAFGFFFKPSPSGPTYYSLDQLNGPGRSDRFIAFQNGSSTNWLFAYEDGTDWDYNDMAVKVESIRTVGVPTQTGTVPEPETYALMMAGLAAVGFMSRRRKRRA